MAKPKKSDPKPLINHDLLKMLSAEARPAHDHLMTSLKDIDLDAYVLVISSVLKTLSESNRILQEALTRGGSNPKNAKHWADKRNATKFKVEIRGQGVSEISGWDNLCEMLGIKEQYIRNLLSQGGGSFSRTFVDRETHLVNIATITRL